jgi:hypothetical protein
MILRLSERNLTQNAMMSCRRLSIREHLYVLVHVLDTNTLNDGGNVMLSLNNTYESIMETFTKTVEKLKERKAKLDERVARNDKRIHELGADNRSCMREIDQCTNAAKKIEELYK